MLTTETIEEMFTQKALSMERWLFTPKWNSPIQTHRYGLTFLPPERRFVLSRAKIEKFVTLDDAELIDAFRGTLSEQDIAECMRRALYPSSEDDVPF